MLAMNAPRSPLSRALAKPASAVAVVPRLLWSSPTSANDDLLEELSERLRKAGASALVVQGFALQQVQLMLDEQRRAAGNYPGPLPILFEAVESAPPLEALVELDGLAGVILPMDACSDAETQLPIVPRCCSSDEVDNVFAMTQTPPLVFADEMAAASMLDDAEAASADSDAASDESEGGGAGGTGTLADGGDSSSARSRSSSKAGAPIMSVLPLSSKLAQQARALRSHGCTAVVVDFDIFDWPGSPEAVVGAVLSKKSPSMSFGMKTSGLAGTFSSEQYWLNKKFKEARALGDKREKQTGSRATHGGVGGGGGSVEAGSAIPKV